MPVRVAGVGGPAVVTGLESMGHFVSTMLMLTVDGTPFLVGISVEVDASFDRSVIT